MLKPKALKKGDTVALAASSGPVTGERLALAAAAVREMGLNVVIGDSCFARYGYLSGSDELRARDLNKMFASENIDGVFVIRGGYGSQRLLDKLDYGVIRANPKVFAGYSDVTALHIAINTRCGFITYHSPMPASEFAAGMDDFTRESFMRNIFSFEPAGEIKNPPGQDMQTLVPGIASGILTGGNLSMIAASLGTPYEINTRGKILLLEDIGEEPYRIDRMLNQLRLAGKFAVCAGIILGGFTDCEAERPEESLSLRQIFDELIVPARKPAIMNAAIGHVKPVITCRLGGYVWMDAEYSRICFYS